MKKLHNAVSIWVWQYSQLLAEGWEKPEEYIGTLDAAMLQQAQLAYRKLAKTSDVDS